MKKVLLTNLYIEKYSGSEIDTVTVANYFKKLGWDVTIFCLTKGYPLLDDLNKDVKIYDYYTVDNMDKEFDLIWAHHFPVLDYLIFTKKIKANYIHYISLSSYEPYESLPAYYKQLNLVSTLSHESLDVLKENKYSCGKINLFTNYSFQTYFDLKIDHHKKIKKVCIVSNHIPPELLEFRKIAKKNNITVDIFGEGHKVVIINESVLKKYDVIISIGKTVNYGLSLGIPTYCYDRFGGDGYINLSNIEQSYYYNFSGRYTKKKLNAEEIYNEIINNYQAVLKESEEIRTFAYNNFCFENNIEKTLEKIFKTEKLNIDDIVNKYKNSVIPSKLIVREFMNKQYEKDNMFKIYYLSEDGSIDWHDFAEFKYYRIENKYLRTISVRKGTHKLRFDICNVKGMVIKKLKINDKTISLKSIYNVVKIDNGYISINNNPYVFLDDISNVLNIEIIMERFDISEYLKKIDECSEVNEELNKIINSKGWKMLNKFRKIRSIVLKK